MIAKRAARTRPRVIVIVGEFYLFFDLQVDSAPAERDVSDLGNRYGGSWEGVIERWEPTGEPDVDPRPLQEFAF